MALHRDELKESVTKLVGHKGKHWSGSIVHSMNYYSSVRSQKYRLSVKTWLNHNEEFFSIIS